MKTSQYLSFSVATLALAQALTGNAVAQETSFSVSAGATYSDNVGRVSANENSELMPEAGMQFSMTREGRLNADIAIDLQYRAYSDDTFDDELLGGLTGRMNYDIVPDRFSWSVEDDFGQSFIDPQEVETPDNRQDLNFFTTGPNVRFPLGKRTILTVSGSWSDVNYEESDFDSQRFGGQIGLNRTMSDTSTLSVNVATQRVEFDRSPPNSDYDLHSAYLAYQAKGARSTLALKGGMTSLRDFGESTDGPLADITLTRQVGSRSTLRLNLGTQFYDAAESFRREREFINIVLGNEDPIPSRDPFQQDYATVAWTIEGARTTLGFSVDWRSEDHETDLALDRELLGANASLSRRIGPRLTATLFGSYGDESFDVGSVDFDEWSAGLGFEWNISPAYGLALRAERHDGSGDTSAGSDLRDYEENRFTLRLTYSPGK